MLRLRWNDDPNNTDNIDVYGTFNIESTVNIYKLSIAAFGLPFINVDAKTFQQINIIIFPYNGQLILDNITEAPGALWEYSINGGMNWILMSTESASIPKKSYRNNILQCRIIYDGNYGYKYRGEIRYVDYIDS